jgi:Cys-tRNA(Pro)/Cys-tRNA(Cys) deacylase
MAVTNNVTRFLDSKKVKYTVFELPAEKLGALETARMLKVPAEQVFKTIVARREKGGAPGGKPVLAVIPGNRALDLKALAAALGEKKAHLVTQREAEQLTGLQTGGISPLALINKGFQVVIDQSAQNFPEIHVSGGQRGLNLRLPVADLVTLVHAQLAAISTQREITEDDT